MKIWIRTAAAAALVCAPLVAGAETLRFTVAEYSSETGPFFEEAAAAFSAANPEHDVQIEVVPWDVLLQKLTTDISGDANADMSIIGTRWLLDFVDQGIAAPLDEYVSEEFASTFFPTFLEPSTMNGQLYGLPVAASARALYYNKDLFEQAGIESVPDTWEELQAAAEKISALDEEIAGFGLQGKEIETDVYYYYAFWAHGGQLINEDGTSGLNSKAGLQAATLYKDMIDEGATQPGVTSYTREDVQNLFKQGKVGMMITAPFLATQIKEEAPDLPYGVAAVPAGPTGSRYTYGVTDSIIVFENSPNKELAVQFLEFIFSDEWRARFNSGEGFLPVLESVAAMPEFADNVDLKAFTDLLPEARFAPVIAGWEEIADEASNAMQSIYLGDGEIQPTLDAAAASINEILSQ